MARGRDQELAVQAQHDALDRVRLDHATQVPQALAVQKTRAMAARGGKVFPIQAVRHGRDGPLLGDALQLPAAAAVPDPHRAIADCGREIAPVRARGQSGDRRVVAHAQGLGAALQVPRHGVIPARSHEGRPVEAEGDPDRRVPVREALDLACALDRIDAGVAAGRREKMPVGAEGHGLYGGIVLDGRDRTTARDLEDARGLVATRRHDLRPIGAEGGAVYGTLLIERGHGRQERVQSLAQHPIGLGARVAAHSLHREQDRRRDVISPLS
ncbi:MAG: hypothetical protein M3495_08380 [Pseudomonadota bacterium]|nr:hypothetical protein [Pseudomonadota bacterium]